MYYSWETNDSVEHIIAWLAGISPSPCSIKKGWRGLKSNDQPKLFYQDSGIIANLGERILAYRPFTTNQAKLALKYVRKYKSLSLKNGFNTEEILEKELFYMPPIERKVQTNYRMMCLEERNDRFYIDLAFPYNEEIINKLKYNNKIIKTTNCNFNIFKWNKKELKWFCEASVTILEFVMSIANDFNFYVEDDLLKLFELYVKEKEKSVWPNVFLKKNVLHFSNITESQKDALTNKINGINII